MENDSIQNMTLGNMDLTNAPIVIMSLMAIFFAIIVIGNLFKSSFGSKSPRVITLTLNKIASNKFNRNKFKDYCGVEIECMNKNLSNKQFDADKLNIYKFSQVNDNSLNDGGVEFYSQPANGDILLENIECFCSELKTREYYLDTSCGMHIHIETEKDLELIKKIYIFYKNHEDLFFSMLPKSRHNLKFCKRFASVYGINVADIKSCSTLNHFKEMLYESEDKEELREEINGKYSDKRYCWINFHSIFYRGTLEIRSHSGTIEANKINNWLLIHLTIINKLKKMSIEQIINMKITKKSFLKLFDKELSDYIKLRWETFENTKKLESSITTGGKNVPIAINN